MVCTDAPATCAASPARCEHDAPSTLDGSLTTLLWHPVRLWEARERRAYRRRRGCRGTPGDDD